jgi:hypothetical protein
MRQGEHLVNRRTARSDSFVDRTALLASLGTCRGVVIHEMTRMKPAGPLYYSGSTVLAAIDALALMLTGQRDYFALKAHSVGGRGDHSQES